MLNEVRLIGRLTKDVEVRETNNGYFLAFTVAVNETYKTQNEWKEITDFIPVEVFVKNQEILDAMKNKLKKGNLVLIAGKIKQDRWQDKEGNKRERLKVVAKRVSLLKPSQIQIEEIKEKEEDVPF